MKKLYIKTLGCAMNTRDTEHIIAELSQKENYKQTDDPKDADLIMINTCSVREKPVNRLFSEIGVFKKLKKPNTKIGVCGCTASHLGSEIIKKAPVVDFVLGARNISKVTQAVKSKNFVSVDIKHDESEYEFASFRKSMYKSFINISSGCDKKCTYCIVPNTRGVEISIPPELIIQEVKAAAQNGAKEVYLLGQNVNNYGQFTHNTTKMDFTDLLKMISDIEDIQRIRFTSPHPLHMDDKFLQEFATNSKICKSMHMPLQSGSSKVLKEMKRGYTKEWFLNRAAKLKELAPNASISTDIIVAFPGESDEDFEHTLDVIDQIKFEQIFSFKYSPRPHTKAAEFTNQVDPNLASSRLTTLQDLHKSQLDIMMPKRLNKQYEVYFDELRSDGFIAGRCDDNTLVKVKGSEELLGKFQNVHITKTGRLGLIGEII